MKTKLKRFLGIMLMMALVPGLMTTAYAKNYTSFTVGDVLHVGDSIRLTKTYKINDYGFLDTSSPYKLVRADITLTDQKQPSFSESSTGAYYLFQNGNGSYHNIEYDESSGKLVGAIFKATSTSDGISVTSVDETAYNPTVTYAVHEGVNITGLTLNPSVAQEIGVGRKVTFTAAIEPADATDNTVKWTVGGEKANAVTLYYDEACTTTIPLNEATETLTVYAKGISAGNATVTCTSNADSTITASCVVQAVTEEKTNISIVPIASAITYGKTLGESILTDGVATGMNHENTINGKFTWETPSTVPAVYDSNKTKYTVVFTPDNPTYAIASCTVMLTVNPLPAVFSWSGNEFTYNGEEQAPAATISNPVQGDQVTVQVSGAQTDANAKTGKENYTATVSGLGGDRAGNYTLTGAKNAEQTFTIGQQSIAEALVKLNVTSLDYTGSDQSVSVSSVKLGEKTLTADSDYEVTGGTTGKSMGPYTATVTGKGNYKDSATAKWSINTVAPAITTVPSASAITYGQMLKESILSGGKARAGNTEVAGTFTWKNDAIAPAVSDSETTEYDVIFTTTDPENYGTAECKVKLTVNKAEAVAATVTANNRTYDGTGKALVTADNSTLIGGTMQYAPGNATEATDPYTTVIPEATEAGTYYVWYKAVGDANHNSTVPACISVTIAEGSVPPGKNPEPGQNPESGQNPDPGQNPETKTDPDPGQKQDPGQNPESKTDPDPKPDSNPEQQAEQTETDISKAQVTVKDQTYTGKRIKPAMTVILGGKELVQGTDYTIKWKNNKKIGKATATLKGKGKYTGEKKVTFKIIPKGTKLSKLKSGKKSLTVEWRKGKSNIDGYEIQYSLKKDFSSKKTVKIEGRDETELEIEKLKKKKTYYVRIRTWTQAGKKKYYSEWSDVMKKKTK